MKTVTAIMVTRGRPVWASIAVTSFLRQTYPHKRLLILDDRQQPSFEDMDRAQFKEVSYIRSDSRSIAEKRNLCCSLAPSDLICHWDDDDWSAPERMPDQVKRLEESGKQVTGYYSMLFFEETTGRAAKYTYGDHGYALGTSLMYTRQWWQGHPFSDNPESPNIGEDNGFVKRARDASELASADCGQLMVARVHSGNTSPKTMDKYSAVPREAIPAGFFA